jgi:hypothetical protein
VQAGAAPIKSCGKDATVVHYQKVVWAEQSGKISKAAISELTRAAEEMQHPRGAAIRQSFLGNQLFGQVKIKVRNKHQLDYIWPGPAAIPIWNSSPMRIRTPAKWKGRPAGSRPGTQKFVCKRYSS